MTDPALVAQYLQDERGLILRSCRYAVTAIYDYVVADHHDRILRHIETYPETLDLAPRGSGKSRVGTIGYVTWRALNDPDLRILVVSDSDNHAVRFLQTIRAALEHAPAVTQNFGDVRGDKWTDHELVLKGRTKILTEATITAHGAYSGAVTSGHYDIIVCDDLVNFENARTEGQRERLKDWFRLTLYPTLIPGGEVRVLGTRYHFRDLYQLLIDDLHYRTQIQRAIIVEDGVERSIWETYMPLEDRTEPVPAKGLKTIRENVGSIIFALQYQNDVELMKKGDIFQYDWFRWYTLDAGSLLLDDGTAIPLQDLEIYAGVDPAVSEKDRGDWFVVAVVGFHRPTGFYFVLDVVRGHFTYEQRAEKVYQAWQRWNPRIIGIEDVGFQKEFVQRIRTTYPAIRVQEIKTIRDKVSRAYSRSGTVQSGRVHVRKGMDLFVEELCLMPDGAHDDQFDGFDFAMEVSGAPRSAFLISQFPGTARKYQEPETSPRTARRTQQLDIRSRYV